MGVVESHTLVKPLKRLVELFMFDVPTTGSRGLGNSPQLQLWDHKKTDSRSNRINGLEQVFLQVDAKRYRETSPAYASLRRAGAVEWLMRARTVSSPQKQC
jgi:hypothetical protein